MGRKGEITQLVLTYIPVTATDKHLACGKDEANNIRKEISVGSAGAERGHRRNDDDVKRGRL